MTPVPALRTAVLRLTGATGRRRAAAAGLLAAALVAFGAVAAPAAERPLRLGIYHPHPRLCLGDEASQRDLRVLRMAFGVMRVPARRLEPPWYVVARTDGAGAGVTHAVGLTLDTRALWGLSPVLLRGRHPTLPTPFPDDRLAAWGAWVRRHVTGAEAPDVAGLAVLGPPPPDDPFFASRLGGSAVLPFALAAGGPAPRDVCRQWPAGVQFTPADGPHTYVLRADRDLPGGEGPGFTLTGYRELRAVWRDYLYGRLDALLLEGRDVDGELRRHRASHLGEWGVVPGTQQVVLRFAPKLARTLGPENRLALSRALARRRLTAAAGAGEFAPARSFFDPVTPPDAPHAPALRWDSLRARRAWLSTEHDLPELRLALLAHPVLTAVAEAVQAQWSRTLNLNVRLLPLPFDRFADALEAGRAEVALDVADLDDGSLQDLWRTALAEARTPLRARKGGDPARLLPRWEAALGERLPYLPLLGNRHWVLLRRNAPKDLLGRVCPGCVPSGAPGRTAPEPDTTERVDPRG